MCGGATYLVFPKMPAPAYSEALREKIRSLPDSPGVYLMKDAAGSRSDTVIWATSSGSP